MPLLWVSLILLLETRSAQSAAADDLATAAVASPRPRECRGSAGSANGLWVRARAGDRQGYCELLARGFARLAQTPAEALRAAEAAEALAGSRAPVRVLIGRAKLRLGQAPAALEEFVKAESEDAQAFLDPKALHDYARAASLAGKPADAVRLYRMLVSRSALLDDIREKSVVQIEAAAHLIAYVQGGADEAFGYLAQARRESLGLAPWIIALRLLSAERAGRLEVTRADSAPPSVASLTQRLSASTDESPLLPPGEIDALRAAVTESFDPVQARDFWGQFLTHANSENVWLAHARKRRAELAAGKGKAR